MTTSKRIVVANNQDLAGISQDNFLGFDAQLYTLNNVLHIVSTPECPV